MLRTPVGRLRLIALIEGCSYLVLLYFSVRKQVAIAGLVDEAARLAAAAPWKSAITITGSIHGALFLLFCAALLHAWIARRWGFGRALVLFIASLIPFGTFVTDRGLRREQAAGG